jgi:tetraacyldisaccharide 4'-kinase
VTRSARPWLAPLTPLYRLAILAREFGLRTGIESTRRLRWPVVSIGSLSAGGAGKTPLTLALAQALAQRRMHHGAPSQGSTHAGANRMPSCMNIDILSRGYGRRASAPARAKPARVDPNGTAEEFGDEPLLLARTAGLPVFVAAERYDAGRLAEREAESISRTRQTERHEVSGHGFSRAADAQNQRGALAPEEKFAGIHLLDDGFQHRQLYRDVDIVLVSARDLNDRLLPAGNLREPVDALRRATILAIPAEEAGLASELGWQGLVWRLHRQMEIPPANGPAVAFCGIARPEQFFEGLKNAGVDLSAQIAFPDHHRYTQADFDRLVRAARSSNAAAFLTTEKDRVRLTSSVAPLAAQLETAAPLQTAQLRIEIEDEDAAVDSLTGLLFSPAK